MKIKDVRHLNLYDILKIDSISIYGSGEIAAFLLSQIDKREKSHTVVNFYDSFQDKVFHGRKVIKYSPDHGKEHNIIICSMYWVEIFANLSEQDKQKAVIFNYLNDAKMVLISEEKQALYIKNPRVASTSLQRLCLDNGFKNKIVNVKDPKYLNYIIFSIIKNPLQRVLSTYDMVFNRKESIPYNCITPLLKEEGITIEGISDLQSYFNAVKPESIDPHFLPQLAFISEEVNHLATIENMYELLLHLKHEYTLFKCVPEKTFKFNIKHNQVLKQHASLNFIDKVYERDISVYRSLSSASLMKSIHREITR